MTFNLNGKKAFITGSTSGIGLYVAQKLEQYGCEVAINARTIRSIDNVRNLFKKSVYGIAADMTSEIESKKAIQEFLGKFQSLDILVCNVGSGRSVSPLNETIIDWKKSLDLNLFAAINPISASINALEKSSGAVTCISSICGEKIIANAPLTYSVAKAALNRYVVNASYYLAKKNIRINSVSPGNVMFPGSIWETKLKKNKEDVLNMIRNEVPLKNFISLEEISNAVVFLSSPLSNSTTGQIFSVDGGQSVT